jgi:DNA N-6-adenine-methyltransferase (Dam)
MKDFNTNNANNDEWLTPPKIVEALGMFDLDPCAPIFPPWLLAKKQFNKKDNGLLKDWTGRVWLNPPYGRETFKWLAKLAEHKNGIALIFSRTETIGFHAEIWEKAHSIFFFKGRLKFFKITGEQGGTANAPSCLVSYSEKDTESIKNSSFNGKLIFLKE